MNRIKKVFLKKYYGLLYKINPEAYKRSYPRYLKKLGIGISDTYYESGHGFIAPSVFFDGNDYSLIRIGDATTVSLDVVFLTHDYSVSKGLKVLDPKLSGRFLKPITVGKNSFIGMRSILLPGTVLGDNTIVGAGSVVKGSFPDGVVLAGNPAKILCTTEEWAKRHKELGDYDVL